MLRLMMLSGLMGGMLCSSVFAQTYTTKKGQNPAFAEVTDDPALPRVLIVGDSISIGYTPALREILKGKANVHRIPTNGGPTSRGIESIDNWLGDGNWDVIHFNWGLHDIVYMTKEGVKNSEQKGQHQVPIEDYEKNLRTLVERMGKTGAKLIWRNTTPVPENSAYRVAGEELPYNAVAARIMKEHNIPTDDHHTYVMKHMSEVQRPENVHFTQEGSRRLAELAAKAIEEQLK
ncbi:SGNH/GDSL hydrolase family protein [Rubinisphaera sp.]|uniref:SGNH/GDSL hydrolase family protein n=1 Tax=Rubinisphaera sp. TaxID=2024857 RepID=UPI0025D8D288|nr:SGNH/GDSL hydrolase family protein [Rubinisphaera sp.]